MLPSLTRARQAAKNASPALKFVVMVGIMSFFADFTYEGSRRVSSPGSTVTRRCDPSTTRVSLLCAPGLPGEIAAALHP
jgi:hypothetical protein